MARMIPPVVREDCPSPGEKELFDRFKNEPGTKDWVVLHSLDVAHHVRRIAGEADFVVIVPALGVLCLEVKACRSLRRREGLWFYGQDPKGDPRGPFKQASEAMHSFRQYVVGADSSLSPVPFWSAVAFTDTEFKSASDEWHPWQAIDKDRLAQQPLSTIVRSVLNNARSHLSSHLPAAWFRDADRLPTREQCAAIARILRPNFEFIEKPPDRRARQQGEILKFTEEQFHCLDALSENDRVLFTGPAGTGKTVLAIEAARRAASDGKKTLLLCFNRLLGRWLAQHPSLRNNALTVRTFHQYLLGFAGRPAPKDADEQFWRAELPEAATARLLDGHPEANSYDLLILDEVQDLAEPAFFDVFDCVLKGGLKVGNWLMFGDFERQMLYHQQRSQIDELVRTRLGNFSRCALRVNCRNTPRVVTLSHLLGRLVPHYTRILRPDDQIEPAIIYYATPSQQRRELVALLARLQKDSFAAEDIVILSPKAGQRCAAATVTDPQYQGKLLPIDDAAPGCIPYTTIQSFKGMEAPAVVVTDIEHVDSDLFSSLFYVATTRALERLCVVVHETAKDDVIAALLGDAAQVQGVAQ